MKRVLALALITMLLLPGIAFAGPSTDAALALGAFAALGTILMGAAAIGHPVVAPAPVVAEPPAPPAVYAPAPPVAAPPPVVYAPQPQAVYAPPPVVYLPAPPPVVYAPRVHRHRYYDRYAYDAHGHRW